MPVERLSVMSDTIPIYQYFDTVLYRTIAVHVLIWIEAVERDSLYSSISIWHRFPAGEPSLGEILKELRSVKPRRWRSS